MRNFTDEKISYIRHIWIMNYSELGWGSPIVNFLEKFTFLIIFIVFSWMIFIPFFMEISTFLCLLPVWILGSAFVLLVLDSIYTSKKIWGILELCKTYVDEELTLEELIKICQN